MGRRSPFPTGAAVINVRDVDTYWIYMLSSLPPEYGAPQADFMLLMSRLSIIAEAQIAEDNV
jgi:hypothetical protein